MKTPKSINHIELICTCESISQSKWDNLMQGTTKANGRLIRHHIKNNLPTLYDSLSLQFYNPYEGRSVKKKGLLVYVHSGIEYFLRYN